MKLVIFTIVLDGQPFIERHLPVFERLSIPWEWRIAEGAALNTHCTKWCQPQAPRLSTDGTSEYLTKISKHPNVRVFRRQLWDGKLSQCNACIAGLDEECVLLQVDVDEFYTVEQIEKIVTLFRHRKQVMRMLFWCNYWLGPHIKATSINGYGNRNGGEWLRAFRYLPGMKFTQHEPPILGGNPGVAMGRDETRANGIVFDHYAWLLESQAVFKCNFYGYKDAASHWRKLQSNTKWPVKDLRELLPWVGPGASADWVENGVSL